MSVARFKAMTSSENTLSKSTPSETVQDTQSPKNDISTVSFGPMNAEQTALYERIQSFSIDTEQDSLSFSQRLARENVWSIAFAWRVIEEYKRFAFLAIAADHPVTPSDQVDQVWHLHLSYTRSYWEAFCPQVLEASLHHEPTKGGEAEGEKFEDWYEKTLESYKYFFEAAPPEDIWPNSAIRFSQDLEFERINTHLNWVIPKLPISREIVGGIVVVLTLAVSYSTVSSLNDSIHPVGGILIAMVGAIAGYSMIQIGAGFLEALHKPNQGVGGCGGGGGSGCGGCGYGCGGGGCGGG